MATLTPETMTTHIVACVRAELNRRQPGAGITVDENTVLVGPEAVLDSLGLVTFAVSLEQRLADATGGNLIVADEQEMTRRNSPFRTVGTLAQHLSALAAQADGQ